MKSFVERGRRWFRRQQARNTLVDQVVLRVDPLLKQVKDYRKQLVHPILKCRKHSRSIVEDIPGPVYLDAEKFSDHPLVRAAFTGAQTLESLLAKTAPAINLTDASAQDRVALLSMTHVKKEAFGFQVGDGMLATQERLTSVTFGDHRIIGLAENYEATLKKLEHVVFDLIIESVSNLLADRMTGYRELQERKLKLSAMWRIFGGTPGSMEINKVHSQEELEKLYDLKALLRETDRELSESRQELGTPGERIALLRKILDRPEMIFNIRRAEFRLDWRNTITNDRSIPAATLTLAQCSFGTEETRDVTLIAFSV